MTILAKDFNNRKELEEEIKKLSGHTTSEKKTAEISGTDEELEKLHVEAGTIIWGIKVVSTSPPKPKHIHDKPVRGDVISSGINGNIKIK